MTVRLYVGSTFSDCPPLCSGRAAGEVSQVTFFPLVFAKFKSCLLLLVALPGLIDIIAQLLA